MEKKRPKHWNYRYYDMYDGEFYKYTEEMIRLLLLESYGPRGFIEIEDKNLIEQLSKRITEKANELKKEIDFNSEFVSHFLV